MENNEVELLKQNMENLKKIIELQDEIIRLKDQTLQSAWPQINPQPPVQPKPYPWWDWPNSTISYKSNV